MRFQILEQILRTGAIDLPLCRKSIRRFASAVALVLIAFIGTVSPSQSKPPASSTLTLVSHVDHLDKLTREPSLVEGSNGTLFVSGYGSPEGEPPQKVPRLWKSTDHGQTWTPVNVGSEADGVLANSDVSLAIAPDGTLYFVSMQFDHKINEGQQIVIGVSKDGGAAWHWTMLSKKRFDDRPWVAVAPDGTAHVIWNDGSGVYHVVSRDRGATWSQPEVINPAGGSSHLAVGPKGEIAVRIVPVSASGNMYTEGVDVIAVSSDGGNTWVKREAPGKRDWAPMDTPGATPRWVEPLAWDSQGDLYSLWTNINGVWLAQSTDQGVTWKQERIAEAEELPYYPFLTARGPGELAATWFSGTGESLRWHVCRIYLKPESHHAQIAESSPLETEAWFVSDEPFHVRVRSSAGEYLMVTFLKNGELAVTIPVQDAAAKRFGFSFWRFKEE